MEGPVPLGGTEGLAGSGRVGSGEAAFSFATTAGSAGLDGMISGDVGMETFVSVTVFFSGVCTGSGVLAAGAVTAATGAAAFVSATGAGADAGRKNWMIFFTQRTSGFMEIVGSDRP